MTKQITRWSPDTCRCVIEYSWDDSVPAEERVHEGENVVVCCATHEPKTPEIAASRSHKNHFDVVIEENKRKNIAIAKVLEALPLSHKKAEWEFKDGEEPKWSFDEDRNVVLEVADTHKPFLATVKSALVADPGVDDKKIDIK